MTELRANTPLKRATSTYHRGGIVVVILHPGYLEVKLKGKRKTFDLSYGAIFDRAVKLEVERKRAEKQSARKKGRR